jgi:hypothetical protein
MQKPGTFTGSKESVPVLRRDATIGMDRLQRLEPEETNATAASEPKIQQLIRSDHQLESPTRTGPDRSVGQAG